MPPDSQPLYVARARYDRCFWFVPALMPLVWLWIFALSGFRVPSISLPGDLLSVAWTPLLLFTWLFLTAWYVPRRLEITSDALRIVRGKPFTTLVRFDEITRIERGEGLDSILHFVLANLTPTSRKTPAMITTRSGRTYIPTPIDRDEFMAALDSAMKAHVDAGHPHSSSTVQG